MPARRASLTRNTLARYAPVATKSAPVTSESVLSQLVTASPAALPTGTRPPAIAPTTVPRKNGVSTDDAPKTTVARARPRARRAVCWNAKPAPRSTIPNAARLSGMNSVEKIDSNADGKPVHRTTRTKISHTWFASHTGPIAQSINSRGRRPRSPPPASRLQSPAPKSAPPKIAYIVTPIDENDGDGVRGCHAEPPASAVGGGSVSGPYGASTSSADSLRHRRDIARSVTISVVPSAA